MFLLFDIGGTKMRFAVSKDAESFEDPKVVPTPQDFEKAMSVIGKIVPELTNEASIEKTAGGIRRLNDAKDALVPDFRLPDWSGEPLKQRLEEIANSEVYLENDTALVGLGEAVEGAGKGFEIVVYLTVSTGVGGVRIVDEKVDANSLGFEPGHQTIDFDWSLYPESKGLFDEENFGQLEAYISGASMERRLDKPPSQITDEKIWQKTTKILSAGIANSIVFWSPDVVVVGGGMTRSPGINVSKIRDYIDEFLKVYPKLPEIKDARLGDLGGLYGALSFIKQL